MRSTYFLVLAALLSPYLSVAQQPPSPQASPQTPTIQSFTVTPNGSRIYQLDPKGPFLRFDQNGPMVFTWPACPVGMEARQGTDGDMVKVRNGSGDQHAATKPGQVVHLLLDQDADGNRIVSATVKVSGLSARTRFTESDASGPRSDLWRTVQVAFDQEKDGHAGAFVKLPGFTSVNSITLLSVTYADGETWAVPHRNSCTVQPNRIMRIAER